MSTEEEKIKDTLRQMLDTLSDDPSWFSMIAGALVVILFIVAYGALLSFWTWWLVGAYTRLFGG